MNPKNFIIKIRERITRWVIVKYLSGGVNPYALLAVRLGLKPRTIPHVRYKMLTGDFYELPSLSFIASDGSKYVLSKFGFIPFQRTRMQQELRELKVEYELLADKERQTQKEIQKRDERIDDLRSHVITLVKEVRHLNGQLKEQEQKFSDALDQIHVQGEQESLIEQLKKKSQGTEALLLMEREKNIKLMSKSADKLGGRRRSHLNKILCSAISPEEKINRIAKYLNPPKVWRYGKGAANLVAPFLVKWLSFFM